MYQDGIVQKLKVVNEMAANSYDFSTGIQDSIYKTSIGSADTRNINSLPSYYRSLGVGKYRELKLLSVLEISNTDTQKFGQLETIVAWSNENGGCIAQKCIQLGNGNNAQYYINKTFVRYSINDNKWGPWFQNYNIKKILSADNTTSAGNTDTYKLDSYYTDFDEILIHLKGDWNNLKQIRIAPSLSPRENVVIQVYNGSYYVYGNVWAHDSNQLSVSCTAVGGWGGLGCVGVFGIHYI